MWTGELASSVGVNIQTLRYYERRGLLDEPQRSAGGYRMYPTEAVRVLRFIRRAQGLGFTLSEIETLLELTEGGPAGCQTTRELATEKLADLADRIAALQAISTSLERLVATCDQPALDRECPILRVLEDMP